MYQGIIDWFKRIVNPKEIEGKEVLEVGSFDVNGSVRPFIESLHPKSYLGVDICEGKGVDEIVDASNLIEYFGNKKFDVVISTEMLEHVYDWRKIIDNLKGVVKPNGYIYLTVCPYNMVYHPHTYDYWRFTVEDMRLIFNDFDILDVEPDTFIKARKRLDSEYFDLSLINIKPVMRTLIITTGIQDFIMGTLLPSLRDCNRGNYHDDILIVDYENSQGSFSKENIAKLDNHVIYRKVNRKYLTYTADRFRVFSEVLKGIYTTYDVIMHIDGNDIEVFKPIQPLLEMGYKNLCCIQEPYRSEVRTNSLCFTHNKWETVGTLPVDFWDIIRDKPLIGCGMFLGPAETMYSLVKAISSLVEVDSRFGSDQLMLNVILWYYNEPFKVVSFEWGYEYYYGFKNVDGKKVYSDLDGEHEIAILHYTGDGFSFKKFEGKKEEDIIILPKLAICIVTPDVVNEKFLRCYKAVKDSELGDYNYTIIIIECHSNEMIFDYATNTNIALKGIDADYYLILNSDCYVSKDSIKELIETTKQDKNIGLVGGLQFKLDGSVCGSVGILNEEFYPTANSTTKENLYKQADSLWVNGAITLITKECLNKVGLLDQSLKLYYTDVEYGVRAWQKGFRVVYQPKSVCIHEEGSYRREYITKFNIDEYGRHLLKNGIWRNLDVSKLNKIVMESNKLHYNEIFVSNSKFKSGTVIRPNRQKPLFSKH